MDRDQNPRELGRNRVLKIWGRCDQHSCKPIPPACCHPCPCFPLDLPPRVHNRCLSAVSHQCALRFLCLLCFQEASSQIKSWAMRAIRRSRREAWCPVWCGARYGTCMHAAHSLLRSLIFPFKEGAKLLSLIASVITGDDRSFIARVCID